jgi:menaquinol-cytochrome c reductase iron-sulfur subunit
MEQQHNIEDNGTSKDVIVINRRSFFGVLLGIGAAGMGALLAVPVLRYVLYPLYAKTSKSIWSLVGAMDDFSDLAQPILKPIDLKQVDGWREVDSSQTVYVVKGADGKLQVLSAICPHMGCTVAWHKGQNEFVCPCHGGRFSSDGKNVFGPPPRGMDPLPNKVEDGKLMVKFEYFRENVPNREVLS